MQIFRPRNFDRAKLRQMRREPLRVEQTEFPGAQMLDQRNERDLRRVGHLVKHGLAEKSAAYRHTVESTRQFAITPRFD